MALKKITAEEFESAVLGNEKTVLVDFYAKWCMPCQMLAPELEKVADETEGVNEIVKIDIDDNMDLAKEYGVMSIPTLIIIKKGKEVERIVGFRNSNQLIDTLKIHN